MLISRNLPFLSKKLGLATLSLHIDEEEDYRYRDSKIPTMLVQYTQVDTGHEYVFIRKFCSSQPEFHKLAGVLEDVEGLDNKVPSVTPDVSPLKSQRTPAKF